MNANVQELKQTTDKESRFDWPLCYDAENLILEKLSTFTERNSFAKRLEQTMRDHTGTLLLDWVDHLVVARDDLPRVLATG